MGRNGKGQHRIKSGEFKKGDYIPYTKVRLQAENYGVHFDDINSDWGSIITYMLNNTPEDTAEYLIP